MGCFSGPEIVNDGLVLHLDVGNFVKNTKKTQLLPDPNFTGNTVPFNNNNTYTNVNHLGEIPLGQMTGNSVIFSGGDAANYSVSRPDIWNIDRGTIGYTGGNWRRYNVLDSSQNTNVLYIVKVRWKFYYVSKTGAGTTNPAFQIGAGYSSIYNRNYSDVGDNWVEESFIIDGSQLSRTDLTFSCTSADSAIEMSKLECYSIYRDDFINDLSQNLTLNAYNGTKYSNDIDAILFDGTDDRLEVPNFPRFAANDDLTIEAWVNPSGVYSYSVIIERGYASSGYPNYCLRRNNQAGWGFLVGDSSSNYGTTDSDFVITNQWQHVVGVLNRSENTAKIYLNGQLKNTGDATGLGSFENSAGNLTIGRAINDTSYSYFIGEIGVVKLQSKALSDQEVKQNFEATRSRYGV